jgi:hypothetical protein
MDGTAGAIEGVDSEPPTLGEFLAHEGRLRLVIEVHVDGGRWKARWVGVHRHAGER